MNEKSRRIAAGAMGAIGLIHLALAPEYLGEKLYVGALFIAGGIVALAIGLRLWRASHTPSWALGALTAAGMGAGFVLSRTTGLPGFHPSDWELSGIVSLLLEGGFVAIALNALRAEARPLARTAG